MKVQLLPPAAQSDKGEYIMDKKKLKDLTGKGATSVGAFVRSKYRIILPVAIGVVIATTAAVTLAASKKTREATESGALVSASLTGTWVVTSVNGARPQDAFQMTMQIGDTSAMVTTADDEEEYPIKLTDRGVDILSDNDELIVSMRYLKGEDLLQFSSRTDSINYTYTLARSITAEASSPESE